MGTDLLVVGGLLVLKRSEGSEGAWFFPGVKSGISSMCWLENMTRLANWCLLAIVFLYVLYESDMDDEQEVELDEMDETDEREEQDEADRFEHSIKEYETFFPGLLDRCLNEWSRESWLVISHIDWDKSDLSGPT